MSDSAVVRSGPSPLEIRAKIVRRRRLIGLAVALVVVFVAVVWVVSQWTDVLSLVVQPDELEGEVEVERVSGTLFAGTERVILFSDTGEISVAAEGYYPELVPLTKPTDDKPDSEVLVELKPLPGSVGIYVTGQKEFEVYLNGVIQANDSLEVLELAAGQYELVIRGTRGTPDVEDTLVVEGFGKRQEFAYQLVQLFGYLRMTTKPPHATIEIDGIEVASGDYEDTLVIGDYELNVQAPDYIPKKQTITVGEDRLLDLGEIALQFRPAYLTVNVEPAESSITFNGVDQGSSPALIEVEPKVEHRLQVRAKHYQEFSESVIMEPADEQEKKINLIPVDYPVEVVANLATNVIQNGTKKGETPINLVVHVGDSIELNKEGYQPQSIVVDPAQIENQTLEFEMITPMEHAMRQAPSQYISSANLVMIEFPPLNYIAKLDLPGNPNPVSAEVNLPRPFYLSKYEITYRDYLKFNAGGNPEKKSENIPVTGITWLQAAAYCNWLSDQEGHPPVYRFNSRGTVASVDSESLGYRLPTELEWESALAYDVRRKSLNEPYPWGASEDIPRAFANLAGRELWREDARYLANHVDNSTGLAPTGSYPPNTNGLHDLAGNASEWVHDFYGPQHPALNGSPLLGPETGLDHVVKGSNYKSSSEPELRNAYRTIVPSKSDVVGFRVARWIY